MYKIFMLARASWLVATSYRLNMVMSLGGLAAVIVPIYFIAGALQPVIGESIANQGGEYFAFLLTGMIVFSFLGSAVNSLPGAIRGGIATGTLEALLTTPTPLPVLLSGMVSYGFIWTAIRATLMLLGGLLLGMQIAWQGMLSALVILALLILSYAAFGLIAAALVLAFRTTGPLPNAVLTVSALLGGVYYPTQVIPSWIQDISSFIPLTYGLRALRHTVLEGMPLHAIASDLMILFGFTVVLLTLGAYTFSAALLFSRKSGTLAQY
ncbi:MAG: ABC transporter permease [Gemmatimonadetes bacterium]|nr:ABC transporter permease [Gemmatimonadota bacterium]